MANGRSMGHKGNRDDGRDDGPFIALPWSVVDSQAYQNLSVHSRALLLEVARQYVRRKDGSGNNGQLLMSRAYMAKRGWKSSDMLTKCKRELIAGGFIFETVMGQRPNKASWYAMTWRALDKSSDYDDGATQLFRRSAYKSFEPIPCKPTRDELYQRHFAAGAKNESLGPSRGTGEPRIAPPHGTAGNSSVPWGGAIRGGFDQVSVPPHGNHLEMPSAAAGCPVH